MEQARATRGSTYLLSEKKDSYKESDTRRYTFTRGGGPQRGEGDVWDQKGWEYKKLRLAKRGGGGGTCTKKKDPWMEYEKISKMGNGGGGYDIWV